MSRMSPGGDPGLACSSSREVRPGDLGDVKREATATLAEMERALKAGVTDQHERQWTEALRSAELTILSLVAAVEDLARHAGHSRDACSCTDISNPVTIKSVRRNEDGRIVAVEESLPHRKLEVGFHR